MKKIIYVLFLISTFLMSCSQDSNIDELIMKSELSKDNSDKKITICHKDAGTISISVNALQAHLDHGDRIAYSPEGFYTIRKVINRPTGTIIGDYFVEIIMGAPDEMGNFNGTGERYLTDPTRTAYVDITGSVDNEGHIAFLMEQWIDDPTKSGQPQNWWNLEGEVAECGGIIEVHWVSGKEGVHEFFLITDV